jgi:hypothetical protein
MIDWRGFAGLWAVLMLAGRGQRRGLAREDRADSGTVSVKAGITRITRVWTIINHRQRGRHGVERTQGLWRWSAGGMAAVFPHENAETEIVTIRTVLS